MESLFLPTRARGASTAESPVLPPWVHKKVAPILRILCHSVVSYPVHAIVIVAALASTTDVRLHESSPLAPTSLVNMDWASLKEGSRQMIVGTETEWKWQISEAKAPLSNGVDHLALLTFVLLDSVDASSQQKPLVAHIAALQQNLSIITLPSTSNPLSAISQDTALVYSIPYDQAAEFLARSQELQNTIALPKNETIPHGYESEPVKQEQIWVMKTTKTQSFTNAMSSRPIDPFKIASNGLDAIVQTAKSNDKPTVVTIFAPIEYELEYRSIHFEEVADHLTLETQDSNTSEWILFALALSVVLHGYLFRAARSSIKEPIQMPSHGSIDLDAFHRAERFHEVATTQSTKLPATNSLTQDMILPPTPADTDDEEYTPIKPRRQRKSVTATQPSLSSALQSAFPRTQAQIEHMLKEKRASELTDEELVDLSLQGKIAGYALEKTLGDTTRAVKIRRSVISRTPSTAKSTGLLEGSLLPYEHYDFDRVQGACCENVIGYLPLPLGVAGPIAIDGQDYFIPMATTEGVLVASTSRGSKAINAGGGVTTVLIGDGMTRGPCISFTSLARAGAAKVWLDSAIGQKSMTDAFNSTSRFAQLQSITSTLAGTYLYPRFKTTTGDAMGMNMISKGVEHALNFMRSAGFNDMDVISVSGNMCTDKKAAAINWINGRGKSVVAEAIIPADVVRTVLKCDVDGLVELNIAKNLVGSALAGAMGGFNAHAANIVAAIFLATGQDPAQVVESANCITLMKKTLQGDLQISVSMPSIEVGTLGGGTILEPQAAMLDMLGVRGSHEIPGDNARKLARIIAATVLAGELSLCSALRAGHLVKSHMTHNRSVSLP